MNTFSFTEAMNEVSGFGGFYERCCRAGICAGAQWCAHHPGVIPSFRELTNIFGIIEPDDSDARKLRDAIAAATVTHDDGTKSALRDELTGAQMHAIIHHVMYIAGHGWNRYVQEMSAPMHVYSPESEGASKSA